MLAQLLRVITRRIFAGQPVPGLATWYKFFNSRGHLKQMPEFEAQVYPRILSYLQLLVSSTRTGSASPSYGGPR